jgi:hypothetical protein
LNPLPDHVLTLDILRMSLARENELDWAVAIRQNVYESLRIVQ